MNERLWWRLPLAVFAVVLGVRLVYLASLERDVLSQWPAWTETDEHGTLVWAERLAAGNWLDAPPFRPVAAALRDAGAVELVVPAQRLLPGGALSLPRGPRPRRFRGAGLPGALSPEPAGRGGCGRAGRGVPERGGAKGLPALVPRGRSRGRPRRRTLRSRPISRRFHAARRTPPFALDLLARRSVPPHGADDGGMWCDGPPGRGHDPLQADGPASGARVVVGGRPRR